MVTAKNAKNESLKGLQGGVYYYLTNPIDKNALLAILHTAVSDYDKYRALKEGAQKTDTTLPLMTSGGFEFQTLEDAPASRTSWQKPAHNPARW